MNTLTVFEHENLGQIRTAMVDGDPWFVAADVCQVLGLANPSEAISVLDDDEKNTLSISEGIRGNPNVNIISEAGLYTLIFRSRKKAAKEFKRWVTHEVLPSIRKTGAYAVQAGLELNRLSDAEATQILAALSHPKNVETVLKQLEAMQKKCFLLETEVERMKKADKKVILQPDDIPSHEICVNLQTAAHELGCSKTILIDYCLLHRFLYRNEDGELLPYYTKKTLFVTERRWNPSTRHDDITILVTSEGRKTLKTLIKDESTDKYLYPY